MGWAPSIANPIGSILSTAMMLRLSFGMADEADSIERAVESVLSEGYRTADISADGGDVVGTTQMGDVIAGQI